MRQNYFLNKKPVLLLSVLASVAFSYTGTYAQTGSKMSAKGEKWSKTGIYGGFTPEQEILSKRSRTTKHFQNADGTVTAQIGGGVHYQDANGFWQDIDNTITPTQRSGYKFSNETNEIKSFFPQSSGTNAVEVQFGNQVNLKWWKTPKMTITVNGTALRSTAINKADGQSSRNSITYPNAYPGMSEQFEIIPGGLESNTIIHSLTSEISGLPSRAMLEFSQVIELGSNWKVNVEGKAMSRSFTARNFSLSIPGHDGLSFSPIVVFDNTLTKQEAMYLAYAPKDKLTAAQKATLANHVFQSDYTAEFVDGGLKITAKLPAKWLKESVRSFPVTIDPTVTVGSIAAGSFYGPMTHWYGYQRHADLYLQSEIGAYGFITTVEYYKTGTEAARTKPTKIYMRSTSASILTGTDAWNSPTYTGGLTANYDGLTTQDNTVGWKQIDLTTGFPYSSGNLLVMVYDEYTGGGNAQYLAQTDTGVAGRQAFIRQDTTNPGDATATAVEDKLQTLRITYTIAAPSITSFTPTSGCSNTGTVVLTGTGFAGVNSVTIGGTAAASFVVNSDTQITVTVGNGTPGQITVTNPNGSDTSDTDFLVNMSPVVAPIAGGAATVCIGSDTAAFTNATPNGVWGVTNGTGSATIADGVVTGVTAGSVTVTYTVSDGTCSTTVSTPVQVNGLPPVIGLDPADAEICAGTAIELNVTGSEVTLLTTIGAGTDVTGTTEELTAFCNRRVNMNTQMIFTAAELAAQGITAGNITSLAFNITTLGSATSVTNFTIKMGTTASTSFPSTNFITTGAATVYGPVTYNHVAGWNSFTLTAPFNWDGTSNIIIWLSNSGVDGLYNAQTYYTTMPNNKSLYKYDHTGTVDNTTTGTLSVKRFNVRFGSTSTYPVTWTPITGLYTDAAGTAAYVAGTPTPVIYAKPSAAGTVTYTASAANAAGCNSYAEIEIVVNPASASPTGDATQVFTAGQTLADLVVTGDNIQWYADEEMTTPLPSTTVLVDGTTYYATQTPDLACESTTLAVMAELSLGTPGFDAAAFAYFPNPVNNVLNLSYAKNITNVSVFNLLGQQIAFKVLNSDRGQIDLSNLASGTYLVKVTAEGGTKMIKVLKQ